jgi:hypothetical protein
MWLLLALAALAYLWWSQEHMTNKDVQSKLDFHNSKPTTWDKTKKKAPKKGTSVEGPGVPPLDPNEPDPTDSESKNSKSVYPDIYGPESLKAPGHMSQGGDSSDPPPYDYVPAAEFPAGPAEPAPYLNDFSKILKT